ncbi:MAG: hypothetical protein GY866_12635 [Proteobacteria bacterium]|nr:hypothetical protein [Pseudomonadota bacterium]
MIRKCYKCDAPISSHEDKCPKCGAEQKSPKIVRKAGIVIKRNVANIRRIFVRPVPPP